MRLPLRARLAGTVVVAVLLVAVGGGIGAVRYGAGALDVGGGGTASGSGDLQSTGSVRRVWFGLEVRDAAEVPLTLRQVRMTGGSNARIVTTRLLRLGDEGGIGVVSDPLPADLQAAVDAGSPVGGAVLRPHDAEHLQIAVLVEAVRPGRQAAVTGTAVAYRALGFDQGVESGAVFCIRAPGRDDCPTS